MNPLGALPFIVSDTDVASFLFNRDPIRGPRYARHFQGRSLVLPFAVVGEMLYGAQQRKLGLRPATATGAVHPALPDRVPELRRLRDLGRGAGHGPAPWTPDRAP